MPCSVFYSVVHCCIAGYFQPAMLGDPWEELKREMGWGQGGKQEQGVKQEYVVKQEPSKEQGVNQEQAKPLAPFYRTGGDGEAERKAWERNKLLEEEEDESLLLEGEDSLLDEEYGTGPSAPCSLPPLSTPSLRGKASRRLANSSNMRDQTHDHL